MYIELHARSAFSFLEGTSSPENGSVLLRIRDAFDGFCWIAMDFMARHNFIWLQTKSAFARTSARK
jgi:hypothetical protein